MFDLNQKYEYYNKMYFVVAREGGLIKYAWLKVIINSQYIFLVPRRGRIRHVGCYHKTC